MRQEEEMKAGQILVLICLLLLSIILCGVEGCIPVSIKVTCSDSEINATIGEQNVKGTITMGSVSSTDFCLSDTQLLEYYCSGNALSTRIYDCPDGCQDGACVSGEAAVNMTTFNETKPLKLEAEYMIFDGDTTNLNRLAGDTEKNFILETRAYGKITFLEEVNVSNLKQNPNLLEKYVKIGQGKISVDTANLSELKNISAEILLRNISLSNPKIVYNGKSCPGTVCTKFFYNKTDNSVLVTIEGFSEFEIIEGSYCGNGICDPEETCSSCSVDCGICGGAPSGGGGVGGGGRIETNITCTPKWNCVWDTCKNWTQILICNDSNECGTDEGRLKGNRSCFVAMALCTEGLTQSCYTGPNGTQNVGICHSGIQTCTNGTWGSCIGEVIPPNATACRIEIKTPKIWGGIIIGIIIIIILVIAVILIRLLRKPKFKEELKIKEEPKEKPYDYIAIQKLVEYITNARKLEYPEEYIRAQLKEWPADLVNAAFEKAGQFSSTFENL